jgi:hypothetical protein
MPYIIRKPPRDIMKIMRNIAWTTGGIHITNNKVISSIENSIILF